MEALKITPRIALSNILFTTDFSDTSERALSFALAIANWYGARLCIAHAVPPEPHYPVPMDPLPVDIDPIWQEAQGRMEIFASSHSFRGITHETVVEQGRPWEVVSRVLRTKDIDLLVLGTHGRVGLKKIVLGSDAEIIFRQASCPVLTVGPHVIPIDPQSWRLKTILFATDFTERSVAALPLALSLAEENQANLLLLHLTPMVPLDSQDDLEVSILARLQELLPADAEDWCKPESIVRFEFPADGILHLANERNVNLIIMGVHKPAVPSATAHLPWATATDVVSRAPCPVLTVRG
jgi:nucleotide-binding universal stress UspA family protein